MGWQYSATPCNPILYPRDRVYSSPGYPGDKIQDPYLLSTFNQENNLTLFLLKKPLEKEKACFLVKLNYYYNYYYSYQIDFNRNFLSNLSFQFNVPIFYSRNVGLEKKNTEKDNLFKIVSIKGIESLPQILFYNPYNFATKCRRP